MDWNSAKKTVIELKKNRAKILKGKFWLNHWGRLSIVESCWVEWSLTKTLRHILDTRASVLRWDRLCQSGDVFTSEWQRYNLWRVENLEFWLRIVILSPSYLFRNIQKNQPITYIRLEAVIISPDFIFTHFHHKVDNSHVFEERWNHRGMWLKGGMRIPYEPVGDEPGTVPDPARRSLLRCTPHPSQAERKKTWGEQLSTWACWRQKRPFFFYLRCYTVPG